MFKKYNVNHFVETFKQIQNEAMVMSEMPTVKYTSPRTMKTCASFLERAKQLRTESQEAERQIKPKTDDEDYIEDISRGTWSKCHLISISESESYQCTFLIKKFLFAAKEGLAEADKVFKSVVEVKKEMDEEYELEMANKTGE